MMKIDPVVRRETAYILGWVLILFALLFGTMLLLGCFSVDALIAGAVTSFVSVLNFFLMGCTVQKAVTMPEKEAKNRMKLSQNLRFFMMIAVLTVLLILFQNEGIAFYVAMLLPILFPRIAILFRPLFKKGERYGSEASSPEAVITTDGEDGENG